MNQYNQAIDFSVDLTKCILWEYDSKGKILALVQKKNDWYQENHVKFWNDWIKDVFDIRTCNQFGLAVWSIILNVPLHITTPPTPLKPTWGFGLYNKNFSRGNFATLRYNTVGLSVENQRILLLLRYNKLTGNCSVPFINEMLHRILYQYGMIYVQDHLNMHMTYVLRFVPDSELWFVLTEADVLPRPSGVKVDFLIYTGPLKNWGFGEYNKNFGRGNLQTPYIEA